MSELLTEEWGVRHPTHIEPMDIWYETKGIAQAVLEFSDEGAVLIQRKIGKTWIATWEAWK
jgi:hypothetical protein